MAYPLCGAAALPLKCRHDQHHPEQARRLPPRTGDPVWIYDVAWGAGTGRVDDVSKHQELLWVILEPTGRRLICGTDDVEVWTV